MKGTRDLERSAEPGLGPLLCVCVRVRVCASVDGCGDRRIHLCLTSTHQMCAEGDRLCSLTLLKTVIWCINIKIVMLNSYF